MFRYHSLDTLNIIYVHDKLSHATVSVQLVSDAHP